MRFRSEKYPTTVEPLTPYVEKSVRTVGFTESGTKQYFVYFYDAGDALLFFAGPLGKKGLKDIRDQFRPSGWVARGYYEIFRCFKADTAEYLRLGKELARGSDSFVPEDDGGGVG
jgi:hypothetical protein